GFGVVFSFGLCRILLLLVSLLIIMGCSSVVILLSMMIGNILCSFISPYLALIFGGCILVFLRLFSLYNVLKSRQTESRTKEKSTEQKRNFTTILTRPDQADVDQSGSISISEAVILGIALALDAFGAGIGASIIGYSPILTTILIS